MIEHCRKCQAKTEDTYDAARDAMVCVGCGKFRYRVVRDAEKMGRPVGQSRHGFEKFTVNRWKKQDAQRRKNGTR